MMNNDTSSNNSHKLADIGILLALVFLIIWYCYDAYTASDAVINLILIVPVAGVALLLCGIEFVQQLKGQEAPVKALEPVSTMLPVIGLFCFYAVTLPWLGFDVGTLVFIALFLWTHGERRWQWVFGYSLVFALLVSLFFSNMLPYPMPMLLLSTSY